MAKAIHAVEFLAQAPSPVPRVCAAFGGEAFLKRQVLARLRQAVLGDDDGEFSLARFDGEEAQLRDVLGELSTMAMFGGGQRLVIVDAADDFVSRYRTELEDYVAKPAATGTLVLLLDSFPSNTRLYKAVAADGLAVDCSAPATAQLPRWLTDWARQKHQLKLAGGAAEMLLEIVGPELGLLDQELAKLATVADADRKVTSEMVAQMVGGWRTKTTWDMLDAALEGDTAGALVQLDRLLLSGEAPVGLLAQIGGSLRRMAVATRLVLQDEAAGRRPSLRGALEESGVRAGFILQKVERQLRRIGRHRGAQLYDWLLQADMDLKGDSALAPRLILERLLVRISAPEAQVLGNRPQNSP